MDIQIVENPFHVSLIGKSGAVEGKCYGDRGKELMYAMWSELEALGIKNHGLNHWVYHPDDRMFTGVEMSEACDELGGLESLEVNLSRYVRHVHIGPYTELPNVWGEMRERIAADGE